MQTFSVKIIGGGLRPPSPPPPLVSATEYMTAHAVNFWPSTYTWNEAILKSSVLLYFAVEYFVTFVVLSTFSLNYYLIQYFLEWNQFLNSTALEVQFVLSVYCLSLDRSFNVFHIKLRLVLQGVKLKVYSVEKYSQN